MSQITGAGFASGAIGAGVNEAIIGEIKKIKDPGTAQIVSAIVGAAAAKAVGGNAGVGATSAASGTRNNLNLEEAYSYTNEVLSAVQEHRSEIESSVLNEAQYLINSGKVILSAMPSDYVVAVISTGEFIKFTSIACIIDKFGSIYAMAGFSPGVLVGAPINAGAGWILFKNKKTDKEEYQGYITGFSGTITAMGGIGGTVGISSSGIIGEIQGGPNVQLGLTLGYTWYVGQIG